jgi:hypothetical protein
VTRQILRAAVLVWGVLLVALILPRLVNLSPGDARHGEALYRGLEKPTLPCSTCHFNRAIAPPMSGISRRVTEMRQTTPENVSLYLAESILYPSRYVVPVYPDVMPGSFGRIMSLQDVQDIVAYLMTL